MRARLAGLCFLLALAPGCCSSCGCGAAAPLAGGPTPYARCAIGDPPAEGTSRVGELSLRIEERTLTVEGLPETFPIALARGPAPFEVGALDELRASGARLVLIAGAIGDDEASATRTLAALAALEVPVLLLAGGRDEPAVVRAALAALPAGARARVIDVSPLRAVRLGAQLALVPVAGAPGGRYARSDQACGVGEDDLSAIAGALGPPATGEQRLLFSWAAPAPHAGLERGDAGSPAIAALADEIGATGALVGWPEAHAGELLTGPPIPVAVAPRLSGWPLVRADGSRATAGALVLHLGPSGIASPPGAAGAPAEGRAGAR